jgi:molybdenum cofactor cytidylyltransferase
MPETRRAILILAAGESHRFGSPKALALWKNRTLLSHTINVCQGVLQARVFVVLGCRVERLSNEIGDVETIINLNWQEGMGTSIACGMEAILSHHKAPEIVVIMSLDQPLVTAAHLQALTDLAIQSQRCAFTRDDDVWGVPAAVSSAYFPHLLGLKGDKGLKAILRGDDCVFVNGPGMLQDVDTPQDLERLHLRTKDR